MRSRYGRSPALDGLRGAFMLVFVLGHIGVTALTGAWVAINLFFVMSGFLITRLLVEEREHFGRVSPLGFYVRRARRLLPGLLLLLTAVLVYLVTLAPEGMRTKWSGDALATLGFVVNWRLVAQGDDYFGDGALPSPVRHAWTLSIEEQYYVLAPFLVMAVFALLRSRRGRVLALIGLTLATTVWAAHVAQGASTNYPRVYYGTDTRVSSLFFGSALGVGLGWFRRGGIPRLPGRWLDHIGWGCLLPITAMVLTVGPYTQWMFTRGGLLLLTVLSAGPILVCADRRPSVMAHTFRLAPLRWLGRISYSLYLWHWPVHLLLGKDSVLGSSLATGIVTILVSVAIAHLSYRYLERPVQRHGVRGLLPRVRRPALAGLLPVALVAACCLSIGATSRSNEEIARNPSSLAAAPPIVADQPEYVPGRPRTIAVLGDSVAWYLVQRFPTRLFPDARLVDLTHKGCDLLTTPMATAFGDRNQASMCQQTWDSWQPRLRDEHPDVALVFAGPLLAASYHLPDGSVGAVGDPRFQGLLEGRLEELRGWARAGGARRMIIVGPTCRDFGATTDSDEYKQIMARSPQYIPEFQRPTKIVTALRTWAERHPDDVTYVDLGKALCPVAFHPEVNGIPLFNDKLHFSPEASPMIWRYLLGQASQAYGASPR